MGKHRHLGIHRIGIRTAFELVVQHLLFVCRMEGERHQGRIPNLKQVLPSLFKLDGPIAPEKVVLECQQGLSVPVHARLRIPKTLLPDAVTASAESKTCLGSLLVPEFEQGFGIALEDRLLLLKGPNKRRAEYCREIFHLLSCFDLPIGSRRGGILTGGGFFLLVGVMPKATALKDNGVGYLA